MLRVRYLKKRSLKADGQRKVTNPTKLVITVRYLKYSRQGAKVYLKPENMQHTGAYKITWSLLQDQYTDRRRTATED